MAPTSLTNVWANMPLELGTPCCVNCMIKGTPEPAHVCCLADPHAETDRTWEEAAHMQQMLLLQVCVREGEVGNLADEAGNVDCSRA